MKDESGFTHHSPIRTGVLLTNLGTPDAATPAALRRYLAEFLWDPRVVDGLPRPLWWLILHGVILRIRPARSAASYRKVWTPEGSPLLVIARRQANAVKEQLHRMGVKDVAVALGMRYGNPSIASALEELRQANVRRVVVLPLYPQYSCSTTASTVDAVAQALRHQRWIPELRFVNQYHDDSAYIEALATSISEARQSLGAPQKLLFSFHGTPRRFLDGGDPYFCHCSKTARLVAERLGLGEGEWMLTFQSRFGREPWLQPYTSETLRQLPGQGVERVHVVCPGFSADCLETLEEIEQENRHVFLEAGGKEYRYIPALNDRPDHIAALTELALRHAQGWELGAEASAATGRRWQRAQAFGAER